MARDSLGMFETWAAFRDPGAEAGGPRCYAIAMAEPSTRQRDYQPYANVAIWPRQNVRGQAHFRLSRKLAAAGRIVLSIGEQRFELTGGGGDAWALDRRMDAAVVAAMRSAPGMTVSARDSERARLFQHLDIGRRGDGDGRGVDRMRNGTVIVRLRICVKLYI